MERRPPADRFRFDGETMLVAGTASDPIDKRLVISKLRVLQVVGRRSAGSLIEATVVPAVLFYVFFVFTGPTAAMLAALAWSYGSVLRRVVARQHVPGVLQLACVALTVRTIIGIAAGTFIYFLQPIATTVALGLVFLGSMLVGRPLIARMASDFCPLHRDIARRPAIAQLFSRLTLLWAATHLLSAAVSFSLLMSLPPATFLALKSFISLAITISAIVLTVSWSVHTARSENLVFASVTA
jgi:intracellular septation protein A